MLRPRPLYEFGDFVLDVGQQRLLRHDSGAVTPLSGKVFDTLLYLVEHAGETLSKDQLLRSIWPDAVVEENSLTQNISTLRQLLGEARGENRYIATIARRGYRFVAQVTVLDALVPPNAAPAEAEAPRMAHSRNRPTRLAIAGVAAALIAAAAAVASLLFVRPTHVDPAGGQVLTSAGSVRSTPGTRDPEAYALYASGQFAWTRQTEESLLQAIAFFQDAIEHDPGYALAYAGLADSYALLGVFGMRAPREVYPDARRAVEQALAIDPQLAAAHSALGHIKMMYGRDWDGAARAYARALQLDPALASAHHRLGLLYAMQGDIDRALAALERARQIEPLWLAPRAAAGNILYYAGRHDESIRLLEQVLALDDRMDNARAFLVRNLLAIGDYDRALAEYDRRPMQMPGSKAHRAQALALSGRREAALAELDRVLALSRKHYVAAYDIALIYAALADSENALRWLERAVEDRSTLINFLAQDPMLDDLHSHPKFPVLVQRIGIYRRALPPMQDRQQL